MNQDMQAVIQDIETNANICEEDKLQIIRTINDLDRELEQKTKIVEAQYRQLEIEAALERVRARAMAMQNSDELKALIGTVFIELIRLDLVLTSCLIMRFDPET